MWFFNFVFCAIYPWWSLILFYFLYNTFCFTYIILAICCFLFINTDDSFKMCSRNKTWLTKLIRSVLFFPSTLVSNNTYLSWHRLRYPTTVRVKYHWIQILIQPRPLHIFPRTGKTKEARTKLVISRIFIVLYTII